MVANVSMIRPGAAQSIIQPEVPAAQPECKFSQDEGIPGKEEHHLVFFFPNHGTLNLQGFYDIFGDEAEAPLLFVQGYACNGAVSSVVCELATFMSAPLSGQGRCCHLTPRPRGSQQNS